MSAQLPATMPFWHVHLHRWGDVKDRQQRCVVCGKARTVECAHKWEVVDSYSRKPASFDAQAIVAIIEVMKCVHCGELTNHEVR